MTVEDYLKFRGITHFGDTFLTNTIEVNLKMWYDYAFLQAGGWVNVSTTTPGISSGNFSQLRLVTTDLGPYTRGQVWEAIKKDWVWEAGITYVDKDGTSRSPVAVGTPTVNGTPSAVPFSVNYPLGRIVFDTPISTTATVKIPYSYRAVQVYRADDIPYFSELQYGSANPANGQFLLENDGTWSIGALKRVQMPCIILGAVPRGSSRPYELGNGSLTMTRDILFVVIAETNHERNKLVDIISQQSDKDLYIFNIDEVNQDDAFPLDANGDIANANQLSDLLKHPSNGGYRWRDCVLTKAVVSEFQSLHPKLFMGQVRTTTEVVLGQV